MSRQMLADLIPGYNMLLLRRIELLSWHPIVERRNYKLMDRALKEPFNRLTEKFSATAFAGRPTLSEKDFDLLNRLLTYDLLKRITADEALNHEWFREVPLPKAKEFMSTFPARSEHDRQIRRLMKSLDLLEEQRIRELKRAELGGWGLFG